MIRLNTESKTRHAYSIGTKIKRCHWSLCPFGSNCVHAVPTVDSIEVWANNRDQAARIAEKAGYEVRDVNMIG